MTGTVRRSRIAGDGVTIALYERGPADAPTVVAIHGYPDTAAMWNPVADRLAGRFHVVTYDVRGAGCSGAPPTRDGYRLERLMGDLEAVIDAVSPDRPVHLVGHDWGSIQGWEAVGGERFEGRIASYTSISGPPLDHAGRHLRSQPRSAVAAQSLRSWYIYLFHIPLVAPLGWRAGGRAWHRLLGRLEEVPTDAEWPAATIGDDGARGVQLYRANMVDRLRHPRPRHTDVPVLLVVPDADRFITDAAVAGIEEMAPRLERRAVEGGHWVARSHPDLVADLIRAHVEAAGE